MWTPAYDADRTVRDGAWVAELTGLIDLTDWPPSMRVIARKERSTTPARSPGGWAGAHERLALSRYDTDWGRAEVVDLAVRPKVDQLVSCQWIRGGSPRGR